MDVFSEDEDMVPPDMDLLFQFFQYMCAAGPPARLPRRGLCARGGGRGPHRPPAAGPARTWFLAGWLTLGLHSCPAAACSCPGSFRVDCSACHSPMVAHRQPVLSPHHLACREQKMQAEHERHRGRRSRRRREGRPGGMYGPGGGPQIVRAEGAGQTWF